MKFRAHQFIKLCKILVSKYVGNTDMTQGSKPVCRDVYKKVTHCIFDLDGTLLDSEVMFHDLIRQICKKYGKIYSKALQIRMYGVTDEEISQTVTKELDLPISAKEFQLQLSQLGITILPKAPLQRGVERLLTHLHRNNVPMAVATNSTQCFVNLHSAARPKLFQMFHHMVSVRDPDVCHGKPSPEIYLVAASRFSEKPKPYQCLVFEDSVYGVQAATGAGMQVVMIPAPRLTREHTRQATLVLRSLLEFEPELFGLPSFTKLKRR